jgi:exodeoxyribonuclease V beta subunit
MSCFRRQFYDYLCEELPKRQQAAGVWSYDDLLRHLDRALSSETGGRLASNLQHRYPAALVDEFQDTDPLQYRILARLSAAGRQTVFLVGDPKQAIYSFRGADVFAYLEARQAIRQQFSLAINWRSTPALIRALNTLFGQNPAAFFLPQIPYRVVAPAAEQAVGLVDKQDQAGPLRIWQLPEGREQTLPDLRQMVVDATANEIARLLKASRQGCLTFAGRPFRGGDIAVLVRKHVQGEQIAQALIARGIHSVRSAQANVFQTDEAEQLERLLLALLEPRREPLLRTALATELLGWRGEALDRLNWDDALLSRQFQWAIAYHQAWRDAGFMRVFRHLLLDFVVEPRLLARQDGERRLTNLYHLAELIHGYEVETRPGMEGVMRWFSRQRQDLAQQEEERQLRLESDSQLVKILTQHASKGLQYPVVFCPFVWDESLGLRNNQQTYLFHDPQSAYRSVFELGSATFEADQRYYKQEQLAENLRLLYVALTRAQYRCYLPWGKVKRSENAALSWLLHPAQSADLDPMEAWHSAYQGLTQVDIQQRLEYLVEHSKGAISLGPIPLEQTEAQLEIDLVSPLSAARSFQGEIRRSPRISSFSSLVAGVSVEFPDHDLSSSAEPPVLEESAPSMHGFPRGPRPGTCLHSIFEQLDFTQDSRPQLELLVTTNLATHGLETSWTQVIADMVEAVLAVDLNDQGLKLQDIPLDRRITEMAFHFPVQRLQPTSLEALGRQHGFAACDRVLSMFRELEFAQIQGFVSGFIDLVIEWQGRFYLLDYKSNWLGDELAAYGQAALWQAMLTHHYPLQYLFYVLALHRYLGERLVDYAYERHFGGVFYLFLRGMHPQAGCQYGVLQERPPPAFIEALDVHLAEGT